MHPALPSYVILAVTRYSESPVGPFNLAVLRLGSRAGAHPRGFLLGAVASTEAAAKELRGRWGLPVEAGEVKFLRRHDRVMGTVNKGGKTILDCALIDPQPVAGTDVQYINWVTAANAPLDGQTQPMLIQVDPKYTFYKAERGKPQVSAFDAAAWNAGAITLADPIVGTCCTVDTDLPRIRFVMDPLQARVPGHPPHQGVSGGQNDTKSKPHPEERPLRVPSGKLHARLEGSGIQQRQVATLRDAPCGAPQGEALSVVR